MERFLDENYPGHQRRPAARSDYNYLSGRLFRQKPGAVKNLADVVRAISDEANEGEIFLQHNSFFIARHVWYVRNDREIEGPYMLTWSQQIVACRWPREIHVCGSNLFKLASTMKNARVLIRMTWTSRNTYQEVPFRIGRRRGQGIKPSVSSKNQTKNILRVKMSQLRCLTTSSGLSAAQFMHGKFLLVVSIVQ